MSDTWKCPKCGSASGVWYNVRVSGWRQYFMNADGSKEFANDDSLHDGDDPKTGKCDSCESRVALPASASVSGAAWR